MAVKFIDRNLVREEIAGLIKVRNKKGSNVGSQAEPSLKDDGASLYEVRTDTYVCYLDFLFVSLGTYILPR
jgi:hypothetical protein